MKKYSSRRFAVTAVTAILLGLLYCLIFGFSAQDAEASGSLSRFVSGKCAALYNFAAGGRLGSSEMEQVSEMLELPLRKAAHFSEYACMGMLVYILWNQWLERGRRLYLLTVGWVFVSAAGDELHQYFVPGRYASLWDVLLDTCGGLCGMLVCVLWAVFVRRRRRKRRPGKTVS